MGEVIKFRRPPTADRSRDQTLCRSGFHKWKPSPDKRFDVKRGKLVTLFRCERCGIQKTELT